MSTLGYPRVCPGPFGFSSVCEQLVGISNTGPVNIRIFADNCVVYTAVTSVQDQLRISNRLSGIMSRCLENNMMINAA